LSILSEAYFLYSTIMYFSPLFILIFLAALTAYGQTQERVAIINTLDDLDSISITNLTYLTDRLRETAVNVLPNERFGIMTTESIVAFLGSMENTVRVCKESSCLAELGRMVSADYVAQGRIGRFDNNLTIKVELYNVKTGNLMGSFTGGSKNISGLLAVIDEKAADLFKRMLGTSVGSKAAPSVAGGIGGVQVKGTDYKFEGEKRYLANISSDPEGASLSFNGVPDTRCTKTPCSVELGEGSVRIIAALEQYDMADTTVSIKQNNQSIRIRMKANFGVLEIKPAFSDGIGKDERWSLIINGKAASSWENRLSPNKYKVELSHRCYEDLSFDVGINRDKREVFDMASYVKLKKGGLVLNAERDGKPVSEVVFVNGVQVGETPFSGSVAVCARVEIGSGREVVDVGLRHNDKVVHTVRGSSYKPAVSTTGGNSFTDSRDGKKYRTVTIGRQTWMAENLNYNTSGSICYDNQESNCQKYGRLYNWNTAKTACPKGWHLPSKNEYGKLDDFVGGANTAGKFLKATSGWNSYGIFSKKSGDGTDNYGFSALPGGGGYSGGGFANVGYYGDWWSATENSSSYAYYRNLGYSSEFVGYNNSDKSNLFSVRCLQD